MMSDKRVPVVPPSYSILHNSTQNAQNNTRKSMPSSNLAFVNVNTNRRSLANPELIEKYQLPTYSGPILTPTIPDFSPEKDLQPPSRPLPNIIKLSDREFQSRVESSNSLSPPSSPSDGFYSSSGLGSSCTSRQLLTKTLSSNYQLDGLSYSLKSQNSNNLTSADFHLFGDKTTDRSMDKSDKFQTKRNSTTANSASSSSADVALFKDKLPDKLPSNNRGESSSSSARKEVSKNHNNFNNNNSLLSVNIKTSSAKNNGGSYYDEKVSNGSMVHVMKPRRIESSMSSRFGEKGGSSLERELVQDLLFIFQGINGKHISCAKDGSYIITADVSSPVRELCLKLSELGSYYRTVKAYTEKPSTGLLVQGLKHGLDNILCDYYRVLAVIRAQFQSPEADTPLSDESPTAHELTLLKLLNWVSGPKERFFLLSSLLTQIGSKTGGELCSTLFSFREHGDPAYSSLTTSLLTSVTKPLYFMLGQWVLYGELGDPFSEFFIKADRDCRKEELWHAKFDIRENMLPTFISKKQAQVILATGKNINFLRDICQNSTGYEGREEIKKIIEETPVECLFLENDKILGSAIERAYRVTSDMVLKVLIHDSRLIHHLKALKKYLLLGQGDFIQYLLELMQKELGKPVSRLYTHNLSAILESAIRATNAQFEEEDILKRLETRLLTPHGKDTGWEVFSLDYRADGPIGTVLTEEIIMSYNRLFNALWRTKRIESILSILWKNQKALFKVQRSIMPEIGPVLHQSQLLIQELIHFVHQTQYYIMFEATECAWDSLLEAVGKAVDLDGVISAHAHFLETMMKRSLLDLSKRDLYNQLRSIFANVLSLQKFLDAFERRVMEEGERRRRRRNNNGNSEEEEEAARKVFFSEYVAGARGEVETLYTTSQDLINKFLIILNGQQDPDSLTLQCLSFRLDFNEYYVLRDTRLSFPLTYLSRRLSTTSTNSPLYASYHQTLGNNITPNNNTNSSNISNIVNMNSVINSNVMSQSGPVGGQRTHWESLTE